MTNPEFVQYDYKVVQSGDVIEIYRYYAERYKKVVSDTDDTKKDDTDNKPVSSKGEVLDPSYKRKIRNIHRTKQKLKRIINANAFQYSETDKFFTLNFRKYLSREEVIKEFKLFNKRLRYQYKDCDYEYIAIIERGGKGTKRLHLHCVYFGLPYIKQSQLLKIWGYGGVNVQAIDTIHDLGNYVLKYIEKTLEDGSYIGKGQKFYIPSRGLKKPQELYLTEDQIESYLTSQCADKQILFDEEFNSKYVGDYRYIKMGVPRVIKNKYEDTEEYREYMQSMQEDIQEYKMIVEEMMS